MSLHLKKARLGGGGLDSVVLRRRSKWRNFLCQRKAGAWDGSFWNSKVKGMSEERPTED